MSIRRIDLAGRHDKSMRKIIAIIFFVYVSFVGVAISYASYTDEIFVSSVDDTHWTDKTNLYGAVDSSIAHHPLTYFSGYLRFTTSLGVPAGATINSLTFNFYKQNSGNSGGTTPLALYINGVAGCMTSTPTLTLGNANTAVTINEDNCVGWSSVIDNDTLNLSSQKIIGYFLNNSDTHEMYWDAIGLIAEYTLGAPEVGEPELNPFTATESGRLKFNLSGNIGYVSTASAACEIRVYQQDEHGNSPLFGTTYGYEATIQVFNANLVDYTQIFPNNTYIGHGYSTTSDTWFAEGVSVHYFPNSNTTFRYDIACYTDYNGDNEELVYHTQSVNASLSGYDPTLVSTPSATQNVPISGEGDNCTGLSGIDLIACNFKNWISNTIEYYLVPEVNVTTAQISILSLLVQSKAPFAYVSAVAGMDFSFDLSTQSALPSFSLVMNQVEVDKGHPALIFTAAVPEVARPLFNWIRIATTIIFYIVFIGYLLTTGRRVFK